MLVTSSDQATSQQQEQDEQEDQKKCEVEATKFTYKNWPWTSFLITSLCIGCIFFLAGSPIDIRHIKGASLILCSIFLALGSLLLIPSTIIAVCLFVYHILDNLGCLAYCLCCCCFRCCPKYQKKEDISIEIGQPAGPEDSSVVVSGKKTSQRTGSVTVWTVETDPVITSRSASRAAHSHHDHNKKLKQSSTKTERTVAHVNHNNNNMTLSSISQHGDTTVVQATIESQPR